MDEVRSQRVLVLEESLLKLRYQTWVCTAGIDVNLNRDHRRLPIDRGWDVQGHELTENLQFGTSRQSARLWEDLSQKLQTQGLAIPVMHLARPFGDHTRGLRSVIG